MDGIDLNQPDNSDNVRTVAENEGRNLDTQQPPVLIINTADNFICQIFSRWTVPGPMKIQPLRLRCVDSDFGQRKESLIVAINRLAGVSFWPNFVKLCNRRLLSFDFKKTAEKLGGEKSPNDLLRPSISSAAQGKVVVGRVGTKLGAVCFSGKNPHGLMNADTG